MFGRDTDAFISRLGNLTTSISGERREAAFLRQRLSHATVDPNGSCLFATESPTDTVGSQNFNTFSTRQAPHLGE